MKDLRSLLRIPPDWWLAACFAANALCCVAILGIAHLKRLAYAKRSL